MSHNYSMLGQKVRTDMTISLLLRILNKTKALTEVEKQILNKFNKENDRFIKCPPVGINLEKTLVNSGIPQFVIDSVKKAYSETPRFGDLMLDYLENQVELKRRLTPERREKFIQDREDACKVQDKAAPGKLEEKVTPTPQYLGTEMVKKGWLTNDDVIEILKKQDFERRTDEYIQQARHEEKRKIPVIGLFYRLYDYFKGENQNNVSQAMPVISNGNYHNNLTDQQKASIANQTKKPASVRMTAVKPPSKPPSKPASVRTTAVNPAAKQKSSSVRTTAVKKDTSILSYFSRLPTATKTGYAGIIATGAAVIAFNVINAFASGGSTPEVSYNFAWGTEKGRQQSATTAEDLVAKVRQYSSNKDPAATQNLHNLGVLLRDLRFKDKKFKDENSSLYQKIEEAQKYYAAEMKGNQ